MGTQVQSISERIKAELANVRNTIAPPSGHTISTKNKRFSLPNGEIHPGPIQAVLLDYRNYNRYYKTVYNSQNPVPPTCFAIAKQHGELAPHEEAEEPQSDDCASCPHNEWGSARDGKTKGCKNLVRIAMVPPDADLNAQPMLLNVTPTALKSWNTLVTGLEQLGMLTIHAITELSFDTQVDYPKVQFKVVDSHKNIEHYWALRDKAQELLNSPMG